MNQPDDPWKRLVDATKTVGDQSEPPPPPQPSIKSLRQRVHALMLALTWRKWSLLAAILAGLIFLAIFLFLRDDAPSQGPIIQPEPPTNPSAP
ncbi:MAG: hypothetical protein ACSHYF_05975 [Verrucomicrobiaceae bacterium]